MKYLFILALLLVAFVAVVQAEYVHWRYSHEPSQWYAVETVTGRTNFIERGSSSSGIEAGPFPDKRRCDDWVRKELSISICEKLLTSAAQRMP